MDKYEIYEKPVMTTFIKIGDKECNVRDVRVCINDVIEEDCKDYNCSGNYDVMEALVSIGAIGKYIGERQSNWYTVKDREKLDKLYNQLDSFESNKETSDKDEEIIN